MQASVDKVPTVLRNQACKRLFQRDFQFKIKQSIFWFGTHLLIVPLKPQKLKFGIDSAHMYKFLGF